MKNNMFIGMSVFVILVLAVANVQAQQTKPFKMTMSGVGNIPLGKEINGEPIYFATCGGHSDLGGGKFDCSTTGYWTHTDWVPDMGNCPGGLETEYIKIVQNHIIRFENGDIMYMVPDMSAGPNYACLYPSASGMYGIDVKTWRIIGGSGRYEGATGIATWKLKGDFIPLGDPPEDHMFGVHSGPFEGYVTLAK